VSYQKGINKSIHQAILSLAWPAIATNVTTPLISLVDVAIVGHIGSAAYIGAIAIGGAMFNMLYWLFNFLRMGTSGLTAQAYGAADMAEATRTLARALIIAVSVSLLMIALQVPLADVVLKFIDAGGDAQTPARLYFSIAIWGAPGVLATYALSGWFLGMQSSRPILVMALVANSLNVVLSFVFVFALHMDIIGVAAGTAIAQWISAIVGLIIMVRKLKTINTNGWRSRLMEWGRVKHFFSINTDIFLRTLCLVAVTTWFTRTGASSGVEILAANTLLMQLFMLFSFFMDGFAFAGEALAGRFYGAGENNKLQQCVRALMSWGLWLAIAFAAIYYVFGENILGLLTTDTAVVQTALDYRLWAVAVPIVSFVAFIWDGVFVGLTRTRQMLTALFAAMIVFFAVLTIAGAALGNNALWLAFIAYLATRGLTQTLLYLKS
jgi:MATE family multidrug resistance protein